jgi:hypothetical protein
MNPEETVKEQLIQILGTDAYNNFMEVNPDVARLCMTVKYLVTQLVTAGRMMPEGAKDHIEHVMQTTVDILSNKPR